MIKHIKVKHTILFLLALMLTFTTSAQQEKRTREEKDEMNQARTARIKNKTDIALFRRQMLELKEYADERKKIPALQKNNKAVVKVSVAVDTTDITDDTTSKTLTGYIKQDIGDITANVYEVTYDRAAKKISAVKRTGDGEEVEKVEKEDKPEKATTKKTEPKATAKKKKGDDDDDDDDADDKPAKGKEKEKDED